LLEIFYFVTPAGTVSENGKSYHYYQGKEDADYRDFDGNDQKTRHGDQLTKQCYD